MRTLGLLAAQWIRKIAHGLGRIPPGTLALAALLGLFGYFWWSEAGLEGPIELATPAGGESVQAFFTQPGTEAARLRRDGPDTYLVEAIDEAEFQVALAAYHLDLRSVRDALLRAHRRGLTVSVVVDSNHRAEPEIQRLERAGIPVVSDGSEGLMHHKFVILDGLEVWTGSMNFTLNGSFRNNNNLLRLRSREAAQSYLREFEEMFLEARFGPLSRRDTPHARIQIDEITGEVLFSPDDGVEERLEAILEAAQEEIVFMAFALTSDPLADAFIRKAAEGVRVRGVLERDQAQAAGGDYERFRGAGLDVRLDRNPYNMHHKVIVIDGVTVVTGSYNFTRSAEERNDENVVILHDPSTAAAYLEAFERLFQEAGS